MVFYKRFAVTCLTITRWWTVLLTVESKKELLSLIDSVDKHDSISEEMVCTNAQGERNCEATAKDIEEADDYFDDTFDNNPDEESDEEYGSKLDTSQECIDMHQDCQYWAQLTPSECEINPDFMLFECKKACRTCEIYNRYSDEPPTEDGKDLGESQVLEGDETFSSADIKIRIAESREYMRKQIRSRNIDPELTRSCKNTDEMCTYWSLLGECENNPGYMKLSCGPACFSCEMFNIENRCPMDRETIGPDVWSPGDLDYTFRRLSSEPYKSKYDVKVLSSPDGKDEGPWVLTMENFVSDIEADRLIEMGSVEGYQRSTDIGDMKPDGTSDSVISSSRTSTNAWCSNECIEDEFVEAVNGRISNMTGIPEMNSEDLQLLRYGPGQYYNTHHDYIYYETDRQGGVRLLTVYLYLNDVEAGGGTNFPSLNLTVMPKRGRVLIWPSVLNSDPNEMDNRTYHQALPVEAGIKYGSNAWFHMRNFKGPNRNGC